MGLSLPYLLPASPGSYALGLVLPAEICIPVGRLGERVFPPGEYLYLGSARGSGGLQARLGHHLRIAQKSHWHIDWLRKYARPTRVWYAVESLALECIWSQTLPGLPGAFIPAPGFGRSDCRSGCAAHLVGFPPGTSPSLIEERLGSVCPGTGLTRVDLI